MQKEVFLGLKAIPFLYDVSDQALYELASLAKKNTFPKHAFIFNEGDETNSLFILLSGKVRVFTCDEQGKEVTLLVQTPVSYFGELALLSQEPRSASVSTIENSCCAIIAQTDFKNWLIKQPNVAFGLIQDLAGTVRRLTDKVKQLALSNVYERTIQTLLEMSVEEDTVSVIHHRPTQQELANMVGASREMVNKIMKELTKGGYIVIQDDTLRIERRLPASW
ncbi:MAG: Crp/Fnr family transcriptional regulator [Methylococcales bacterium]|nr:Crp/Fnr family transcriptional regulator [Methylococcales bacterium]